MPDGNIITKNEFILKNQPHRAPVKYVSFTHEYII